MHNSDGLYPPKFALNTGYDLFFEEDDFQDFENEEELERLLNASGFEESDDFLCG